MKKYKRFIGIIILLLILAAFTWYITSNWAGFQDIQLSNPAWLIPAILLIIINLYSIGAVLEVAVEPHGVFLSKKEILGLSSITRFANNVTPSYLGTAIRAVYLKKKYDVSYAKFTSSFAVSNIVQLVISGVLALLILISQTGFATEYTMIVFMLVFILFFVIVLSLPLGWLVSFFARLSDRKTKKTAKVFERLSVVVAEYGKIRSQPKLFIKMFVWTLVALLSTTGTVYFIYLSLGLDIPFISAAFIAILGSWAIVFAITPGNIGVSEGLLVIGAQLMGVSIPITIAVAILRRLVVYLVTFILASYFAPKLLNMPVTKMARFR